jgi:hypothetical protein
MNKIRHLFKQTKKNKVDLDNIVLCSTNSKLECKIHGIVTVVCITRDHIHCITDKIPVKKLIYSRDGKLYHAGKKEFNVEQSLVNKL